jgi:hypothetical protein
MPEDAESYEGLPPTKADKADSPSIVWVQPDPDSMAVVSIREAATKLGLRVDEVEGMVRKGEVKTVPIGLLGTPWVPAAEVERLKVKAATLTP